MDNKVVNKFLKSTVIIVTLSFTAYVSAQAQNNSLPPILSLILNDPSSNLQTIVFDTPTNDTVFIIPDGVTSINVIALGASGGDGDSDGSGGVIIDENGILQSTPGATGGAGGAGGRTEGTIIVTPGEELRIVVGREGRTQSRGGDGGGHSEILRGNTALIVAGGGGGGGAGDGRNGINGGNGGHGGGLSGNDGDDIPTPEELGISESTPGLGGQGAVENTPGNNLSVIAGSDDDNMFGVLIQGSNGGAPGIEEFLDLDGVPDVIGAPSLGDVTFGGCGSGVTNQGGKAGNDGGGGGGSGYAGGGGGLPSTYSIRPIEVIFADDGFALTGGNELGFSAGGGGGGGSSFVPEGGSTEVGVNVGDGRIIINY